MAFTPTARHSALAMNITMAKTCVLLAVLLVIPSRLSADSPAGLSVHAFASSNSTDPQVTTADSVIAMFAAEVYTNSSEIKSRKYTESDGPVYVPTINASWHIIDNPKNSTCQVLVQSHLLLDSDLTTDSVIGDNPPAVNGDQGTFSAYPVPQNVRSAVNMTIVTTDKAAAKKPCTLQVKGPNSSSYTDTTAANIEADMCCNATVKLTSSPTLKMEPTVRGYAFNTSYVIVASDQDALPRRTALDGVNCATYIYNDLNQPVKLPQNALPLTEAAIEATQPISIKDGKILGVDGMPLAIKGVNWFGFETAVTVVHGLWQGPTALTQDFQNVVLRIKLLGFNTIRLPFSFQVLLNLQPRSFTAQCQATTWDEMKRSVVPPGVNISDGVMPPDLPARDPQRVGWCNDALPDTNVYARFLYFVRYLAANGFYVIIDNHFNVDSLAIDQPDTWVQAWTQLLKDIVADNMSAQRVMVDILNEPDSRGLKWKGTNPDMTTLYLRAMDAMYKVSKTTLFLIEGSGQLGSAMNWGDGFITDASAIRIGGISDPNPFFTALLGRPYLNNVIISPHYYPPSVSTSTDISGSKLWEKMTLSFGYLTKAGYGGHIFPVVIGETGTRFETQGDVAFMEDMAAYMRVDNAANDGLHAPIPHMVWWDWNPNSGDTGGLVLDGWTVILWDKIDFLVSTIDLQPWYMTVNRQSVARPSPQPSLAPLPPVTSPTPAPTKPFTTMPTNSSKPPSPTPPSPKPSIPPAWSSQPPAQAPAPAVAAAGCAAAVTLGNPWNEGAKRMNTVSLAINNTGGRAISAPWTLEVCRNSYAGSNKAWNWGSAGGVTVSNGVASGQVTVALQPKSNNTVSVGANIQSTNEGWFPDSVSVNGTKCTIANASTTSPTPPKPPNLSPPPPAKPSNPPPPPPPAYTCDAVVLLGNPWSEGAKRMNTVSLTLSNRGAKPIAAPYTLEVHYKGYLSANTPWHWGVSIALKVSNGVVSGPVTLAWATLQPNSGNKVGVGANIQSADGIWFPVYVTINGAKCNIIKG